MIVNVRGMHGSGKSTLVRKLLAMYKSTPIYIAGRKTPVAYKCRRKGWPKLVIVGNYSAEVGGGCDSLPNVRVIYGTIRKYAKRGWHVVYEGIVAQHGTPHIVRIHEEGQWPICVVVMDIPRKKALRGVKRRRRARGNHRPFDVTNFNGEIDRVRSTVARCESFGVRVIRCSTRRATMARVVRLVGPSLK